MALPSQIIDQVIRKLPVDVQQFARSICASGISFFGMIHSPLLMLRRSQYEEDILPGYGRIDETKVVREFAREWVKGQYDSSQWHALDEHRRESAVRMQARKWGFRVMPAETDAILERLAKCTTVGDYKAIIQHILWCPQENATADNAVDFQRVYDESRQWMRQVVVEYNAPLRRQGCEPLPEVPPYRENSARAGLDDNLQWCDDAIRVVEELPARIEARVITETIELFRQLRELPASQFPKIDESLFERTRLRTQRIFDKCTTRTQYPRRIPFKMRLENPRLQWVASAVAQIAWTANDGPLQPLHGQGPLRQIPMDGLHREACRELQFYTAVEKIYRLADPQYANGLDNLQNEIVRVAGEINKLDSTDAGRLIDAFDKLTSGGLQDLYEAIGRAHDMDQIVAFAMFGAGADQLFHRESREPLIDKAIARLESIRAEGERRRKMLAASQTDIDTPSAQAQPALPAPPTNEAPALQQPAPEPNGQAQTSANGGAHVNVNIQNSNVTMGDISQTQNLATGNRNSIGKQTPTSLKKKNIKRTITASVLFLAALLTILQILFGWMGAIWRFLTGE